MTKLSLSIIMLGVRDLERSAAFYVENLGTRVVDSTRAANFADPDGHSLSIFGPEGAG